MCTGGRNMVRLLTKEGRSNVARDSPAPDPPQAENNVTDHDQDHNGAKGSGIHILLYTLCYSAY